MSMDLVLVINCGSTSLKFSIINPYTEEKYFYCYLERLYLFKSCIIFKNYKIDHLIIGNYISHLKAFRFFINNILSKEQYLLSCIKGIGHRVVHGGKFLKKSTIINKHVIQEIKNNIIFSPLHNPVNLLGIEICLKYFPLLSKKNVAVLDTSFYKNIPLSSYLYAIPYYFYKNYNIRRYGAHGISHYYVIYQSSKILNIKFENLNVISCHLGGGCSITAFSNGKCLDTSMGVTPLEGLIMGTRSGDIDPSIIFFMHNVIGLKICEIEDILINKSGILGLTDGKTSDFRYIEDNYFNDIASSRAVNIFCNKLSKYIGAYATLFKGKLDAIIFTGGIGENSSLVRKMTIANLSILGILINNYDNERIKNGKCGFINIENTIPIIVIPTNEDLVIAKETLRLCK